jgi:hypothetical protein
MQSVELVWCLGGRTYIARVRCQHATWPASLSHYTCPLPLQVLGQLIELIDCQDIFYRPVEVTAKERLFFTVVDCYDTSSRLMDALAARRAGGCPGVAAGLDVCVCVGEAA